jgi:glycosyltransferase involved in cell wall biosynthesis
VAFVTTPRLLLVVNAASYFLSHRLRIALEAREVGFEVHVATAPGPEIPSIVAAGLIHHALPLTRSGTSLFSELRLLGALYWLFRTIAPDLVHLVTIKPVLYGGITARLAAVPAVVAAVPGLGFVFVARGLKAVLVRTLVGAMYRLAFGKRRLRVIFQNAHDREALVHAARLPREKVVMIRGSGVDLSEYTASPLPDGVPVVVLASRLLRDKGVHEFVAAAELLKRRGLEARFWLVGDPDPGNPASVDEASLSAWRSEGTVELLGHRNDIARVFAQSSIVVLPSYYGEGVPKVLLEAAACGRAVVTTDMPGCRDAIEAGVTGLVVPPRDSVALADAVQRLLDDGELRARMGCAGRQLAEREFSIEYVIAAHLALYRELMDAAA